jgi:mono/diheme cytochrome c family protein
MRRHKRYIVLAVLLLYPGLIVFAQNRSDSPLAGEPISRGKYIVEHLAMCTQCHTPRNEQGDLLLSHYLKGAPVPVQGPRHLGKWALRAPAVAGFPGYTRQEGLRLLMDGVTRDGRTPSPPMPPFRMKREDAEAVVAYLQSLE